MNTNKNKNKSYNFRRRDELTTDTLDMAIAAEAIQGCKANPQCMKAPEKTQGINV